MRLAAYRPTENGKVECLEVMYDKLMVPPTKLDMVTEQLIVNRSTEVRTWLLRYAFRETTLPRKSVVTNRGQLCPLATVESAIVDNYASIIQKIAGGK